jgi:hypothetical protein
LGGEFSPRIGMQGSPKFVEYLSLLLTGAEHVFLRRADREYYPGNSEISLFE